MMYLKIPTINKKYTPLKTRKGLPDDVQEAFAKYMAEQMKIYLQESIKTQRYKQYWKPLSVDYMEYKKKKNLSLNIWEASGVLVDSITYRKYGDHYIVGISKTKRYPKTNIPIYRVAEWMEYGTETMPARPLFRRVLLYMRKNINRFYKKFEKDVLGL